MEPEELRSEEGGNELPQETPTEISEDPGTQPEEINEETADDLYELPDGRKVDAQTLSKEWKENFYPEYTRKSQELAQVKQGSENINNDKPTDEKVYNNPDYSPNSYAEIIEIAKQEAIDALKAENQAELDHQKTVEDAVSDQLSKVREEAPNIDENQLFLHANKYGFRDLTVAYQNMKDMNQIVKKVQDTTAKNIAKRNDPVSAAPGAVGNAPDPSSFENAREYVRSLNN